MVKNKMIYLFALLVSAVFLVNNIIDDGPLQYSQVLPEAGYCIEKGKEVSYSNILNGETKTTEYCRLQDFCEEFEAITIDKGDTFDEVSLNLKKLKLPDHTCFADTAKHVNNSLTSKFMCCNPNNVTQTNCQANTCGGRYTGSKDSSGCKLYAIELCGIQTNCSLGEKGVIQSCTNEPSSTGCNYKTEKTTGITYFDSLVGCGDLKVLDTCGKVVKNTCNNEEETNCDLEYKHTTRTFVEGCGGAKNS